MLYPGLNTPYLLRTPTHRVGPEMVTRFGRGLETVPYKKLGLKKERVLSEICQATLKEGAAPFCGPRRQKRGIWGGGGKVQGDSLWTKEDF